MFKGGKIPTLKLDKSSGFELKEAMLKEKASLANKIHESLAETMKDMDYRLFQMAKYSKHKYAILKMEAIPAHQEGDAIVGGFTIDLIPLEETPECFQPNDRVIFLEIVRAYIKKTGANGIEEIDQQALKEYYEAEKGKIREREQNQNG